MMPLYKEINLDFVDEQQMQNGKFWGKNGRKFSTAQKRNEETDRNDQRDSPLRAKIFEVIKEQDEKTSNNNVSRYEQQDYA